MTKLEDTLLARGNPGVMQRTLNAERSAWPTTHEASHLGYTTDDQVAAGRVLLRAAEAALDPRAGHAQTYYLLEQAIAQAKAVGL